MATTPKLELPLATLGDRRFRLTFAEAMQLIDAAVGTVLTGSKTHNFASISDGDKASTTLTITGVELGDFVVSVSVGVDQSGLKLFGYVSGVDTVTVVAENESGAPVDLASTTLAVLVRKA